MKTIKIRSLDKGQAGIRDSFLRHEDVKILYLDQYMVIKSGTRPERIIPMKSKFGAKNDFKLLMYTFIPQGIEQLSLI